MASYHFLIQQLSDHFEGCEFHHVPRADSEAADTVAKIGSTRQAIPTGISLEQLRKSSIKPSPESASIFVPADPSVQAPSATPAAPTTAPVPATLALPTLIAAPATTTSQATSTNPTPPSLESYRLDTQWVDVMEVDGTVYHDGIRDRESRACDCFIKHGGCRSPWHLGRDGASPCVGSIVVSTHPSLPSSRRVPQEEAEARHIQR
ncbi:hypothetical protein ZWY2020_004887 [Hordeum vulgare]|nr:hypothetical protein ZWY2020_004887 [Hordeum vulgare]